METTSSNTTTEQPGKRRSPSQRTSKPTKHLTQLLQWYGHVTVKSLKHLPLYYTTDAFFKDPITEVYTTEEIQKHYLSILDKISDVHFIFENTLEKGNQAFVDWTMNARFMGREFSVEGASHLKFNDKGLCEYHRVYLDLAEEIYEQVPVLGFIFKGIKRVLN